MRLIRSVMPPARGFSLVELMVAMAAGLIVLGAAVIFAVTSMRSYSENILSAKLTQELRSSMNLVVRELRRAGYDSTSVSRVLTTSSASGFTGMTSTDPDDTDEGCVTYTYDRAGDTEIRGFRLSDGTLQLSATDGPGNPCTTAGTVWQDITDPEVVTITKFAPKLVESKFCTQVAEHDLDPDPAVEDLVYDMAIGSVRTVSLCLQGQLASGDPITRHVTDSVRIRAEYLEFKLAQDDNTCVLEAEAPADPTDLHDGCDD